jgi:regulator of PEP synthase PpsR (kinase-PPPase family)
VKKGAAVAKTVAVMVAVAKRGVRGAGPQASIVNPQPSEQDKTTAKMSNPESNEHAVGHTVFFVSDSTGLTAESYGKSLLAQFPELEFVTFTLAFVDTQEKAISAGKQINAAHLQSGIQPVVFSTLVDDAEQDILENSNACVINLFHTFLGPLEKCFKMESAHTQGMFQTIFGEDSYQLRLDAIDYSLSHDDGIRPDQYDEADVILVGVSRCGKTPTSLYLAMNFSLKACNYPLIAEDLEQDKLPDYLMKYKHKMVGLTIKPVPLSRIRRKRRPDSEYASLSVCQREVRVAERMFDIAGLPVFDTTETSIEEIASHVVRALGISRERTGFA